MKPYSLQLGAETGRSTVKISVSLSQKSKDRIQYHPPIPLLYTSSASLRHPCSAMFIATLFTMAKKWNHHPFTDSRIKKPCIYTTKCYVLTRKKQDHVIPGEMDDLEIITLKEITEPRHIRLVLVHMQVLVSGLYIIVCFCMCIHMYVWRENLESIKGKKRSLGMEEGATRGTEYV